MQLILNTDADIGIRSNMSVIEQESLSLDTKITDHDVTHKIRSVTEINSTSKDLENFTNNAIETENVFNSKESNTQDENSQEFSSNSNEIIKKEEENVNNVDNSIENHKQNEDEINTNEIIKQNNINTCQNHNKESEDHLLNQLDTRDNKDDICDEMESNLHKSDDGKLTENLVHEPSVTEEYDSNMTVDKMEKQVILDATSSNVSCNEDDSSINVHESQHQEIQEQEGSDKPHEIEMETKTNKVKNESDKFDVVETEFNMRVKNVSEINQKVCESRNKEVAKFVRKETNSVSNNDEIFDLEQETDVNSNQKSSNCVKNEEVIDIADERDDKCVNDKICDGEKDKKDEISRLEQLICNQNKTTKKNVKSRKQENVNLENKNNDLIIENLKEDESNEVKEEKESDTKTSKEEIKETQNTSNIIEKKQLLHISKLSNTLDILSDDDDNEAQVPKAPENKQADEKQCINIEDDDDIMLIDEETSDTNKNDNSVTPETDVQQHVNEETKDKSVENDNDIAMDVNENSKELPLESTVKDEKESESKDEQLDKNINSTEEKSSPPTPLIPVNFFKSCKKNFAEMTREELEEFCVHKIVESVVDRSNLGEMNLQLKAMSQNIDEYKKRTITLIKQNRDLQVVLKSIQEEQKKNSGQPITPLKITRSVGMQVLMIETPISRKKPVPGHKLPANTLHPAKCKNPSPRTSKGPINNNTNNQQIPVPRLVPAVNNTTTNNKQQSSTASPKVQAGMPNGVRTSPPVGKPEKRSYNKMQQGNSVTVDLTDDEPPSKVVPRNIAPPVRLVPQQSLLTAQRPQFVNTVNSPRKVYIPISGSQNPVRPGQTIMLKQVATHVPKVRCPGVVQKSGNSARLPRIAPKHPAPLPDSVKQYQPPNWKDLPPAPELKLSKVENGIVISWKIDGYQEENHEEIASYQLFAYQETAAPPNTSLWKKIGDVKALPLPMACTLTQFMAGYKYYFAVRAVDVRSRLGPFSLPGSILLLNKI